MNVSHRTLTFLALTSFACLLSSSSTAFASVSTGTIDATAFKTRICHDTTCASPAPGIVNFRPTGTTPVTIDDTSGVDGIGWGSEIGWITFDPTGPEEVTIHTTTGALSGKAWAQGSGWINFRPANSGTLALGVPIGVSINTSGELYGWAWTGGPNGGWMLFDCSNPASCVKTDWRPLSARSVTPPSGVGSGGGANGAPGGGVSSPSDMCWNVDGIQFTVPPDMARTGTDCFIDRCPNLSGVQASLPNGFEFDTGGLCVPSVDYCPNIAGVQPAVPLGMSINVAGSCVSSSVLPNQNTQNSTSINNPLIAVQNLPSVTNQNGATETTDTTSPTTQTPSDQAEQNNTHSSGSADMCPNFDGVQGTLPHGFVQDLAGWCVPESLDMCPNLPGAQSSVPVNSMIDGEGNCIPNDLLQGTAQNENQGADRGGILGLIFIPQGARISVPIPALTSIVQAIIPSVLIDGSSEMGTDPLAGPQGVDLVSVVLLGAFLGGLGGLLFFLIPLCTSSGIVYDYATKEVLKNVTIEAINDAGEVVKRVVTNSRGRYHLRLSKGSYTLRITGDGYHFKTPRSSKDGSFTSPYRGGKIIVKGFSKVVHDIPLRSL